MNMEATMVREPQFGEYVLATRHKDGDPPRSVGGGDTLRQ